MHVHSPGVNVTSIPRTKYDDNHCSGFPVVVSGFQWLLLVPRVDLTTATRYDDNYCCGISVVVSGFRLVPRVDLTTATRYNNSCSGISVVFGGCCWFSDRI